MQIDRFEQNGRTLMVQFECRRCKKTALKSFEKCLFDTDGYRNMTDFSPPPGWRDGGFYYPLFCPECAEKYDRFMRGEDVDGQ